MKPQPPHLIDLFCGRGGWTRSALAHGWTATGFDVTDHGYPAPLVLCELPIQARLIQQMHPSLVVASPPCEEFARAHLPWLRGDGHADETLLRWSISLVQALDCPVIVECSWFAARHVQGAILCGSLALWGDVPALLPQIKRHKMSHSGRDPARRAMIPRQLADWIIESVPAGKRRQQPDTLPLDSPTPAP